jgi:lysophospholipase L1-like esterase
MRYVVLCWSLAVLLPTTTPARAADRFELKDGNRVVLIGSTLVEREQRHGYWEVALTARFPKRNVTFRNLGWSGDTVFGEAQAGFGSPADGFRHLKDHVLALKPTVLIVGYGSNESFDGESGLPRFVKGLNTLLDALSPTRARVVLLSPLRQERLTPPLPDPARQNKNLELYTDAIRKVAEKRGCVFVDLFHAVPPDGKGGPLTDNGIHLTADGYRRTAPLLEKGLFGTAERPVLDLPAGGGERTAATLPGGERVLRVRGLEPGRYTLHIDGKPVRTATAAEWQAGVALRTGPDFDQAEKLRAAIVAKDRLYFHRWRPQNETYLFGFRKHEQGQNAREIPQFDPLVAAKEKEIAHLRVPLPHTYRLERAAKN